MKRKEFITDLLKVSIVGGIATIIPSAFISDVLAETWEKKDILTIPYNFTIYENDFQKRLKYKSLPKVVVDKARITTPNKRSWNVGEGKSGKDIKIVRKSSSVSRKAFTPAVLLQTSTHEIYGQFLKHFIDSNRGGLGIIRGFDNRFYAVYPSFKRIFTYKHACYGLPSGNYKVKTCGFCGETYVTQEFKSACDGVTNTLFAWIQCKKSNTGYHDNIDMGPLAPCHLADDIENVGAKTDY